MYLIGTSWGHSIKNIFNSLSESIEINKVWPSFSPPGLKTRGWTCRTHSVSESCSSPAEGRIRINEFMYETDIGCIDLVEAAF